MLEIYVKARKIIRDLSLSAAERKLLVSDCVASYREVSAKRKASTFDDEHIDDCMRLVLGQFP